MRRPLTPLDAIAVNPGAWDDRAAKQRLADRLGSIEHIVLKIMAPLTRTYRNAAVPAALVAGSNDRRDAGAPTLRTHESLHAAITRAVGATLAAHVQPAVIGTKKNGRPGVLTLAVDHGAYRLELRQHLPALTRELAALGIKEVRLR